MTPDLRNMTAGNGLPACKICGASTAAFGVVDFNKSCEEIRGLRLPPTGVEVAYLRCSACGLLFTTAFDDWSQADFQARIYNEGYAAVDPEFEEKRPLDNAGFVSQWFGAFGKTLSVLDYGAGNGRLAEALRAAGFTGVTSYDPYSPQFSERPRRRANLVTCFETIEHMNEPKAGAADIAGLLHPKGLLLLTTMVQPADIARRGMSWWYAGPRNGHVTLHTHASLAALWKPHGLKVVSYGDGTHVAFRVPPAFARGLLAQPHS